MCERERGGGRVALELLLWGGEENRRGRVRGCIGVCTIVYARCMPAFILATLACSIATISAFLSTKEGTSNPSGSTGGPSSPVLADEINEGAPERSGDFGVTPVVGRIPLPLFSSLRTSLLDD